MIFRQSPSSVPLSHSSVFSRIGHKRTQSLVSKTYIDDEVSLKAMEWDLARQTRKLQKLKYNKFDTKLFKL